MPLSFGIPLGIIAILVGVVLFFAANNRRLAKTVMGVGVVITLLTLLLIVFVISSPM